ncbi:MAG: hypothetical protein E6G50_01190 [Actinobacteria bacterium]|nr:MAG: hypothetical protein E6G50_01190 [Actinomycetota bacterium]
MQGRDDPQTVRRVLGRVLLWGRVVEHELGWRASHALPLDLVPFDVESLRRAAAGMPDGTYAAMWSS